MAIIFRIKFNQRYYALCPSNSYNANLGRTKEIINIGVIKLHTIARKRKRIEIQQTERRTHRQAKRYHYIAYQVNFLK